MQKSLPLRQRGDGGASTKGLPVPAEVCEGHTLDWVLRGLDSRTVLDLNGDLGQVYFLFWPQQSW